MHNNIKKYSDKLTLLKEEFQFRQIKAIDAKDNKYLYSNDIKYLNLSSNNYLGIADNKELIQKFIEEVESIQLHSYGSASARLLTGNLPAYTELENTLCKLYEKDACLLFNSGYQANVGIMSSLASKNDVIFSDKLNHASIIDGMKLSDGDFYRYKHLDYDHLENLLKKHRNNYENAIIVTESVFSMDGDIANLNKLIELKNKYNAILIVDEAHAFGIFGKKGLGACEVQNAVNDIDLIVGTFGKSIGSTGAYAVGSQIIIDYLINNARSFIFSTAMPPVCVAWSNWVINNILPNSKMQRDKLLETSNMFRNMIKKFKLKTLGKSHIVPIIIGDNNKTTQISDILKDKGYWVLPIRPPTVPQNSSRLRISLTTEFDIEDIQEVVSIVSKVLE